MQPICVLTRGKEENPYHGKSTHQAISKQHVMPYVEDSAIIHDCHLLRVIFIYVAFSARRTVL